MAIAVSLQRFLAAAKGRDDGIRFGFAQITMDNSYVTNGEPIAASDIDSDLNEIIGLDVIASNAAANAYTFRYDSANAKIEAYDAAGEVANATDLSGCVFTVLWFGR